MAKPEVSRLVQLHFGCQTESSKRYFKVLEHGSFWQSGSQEEGGPAQGLVLGRPGKAKGVGFRGKGGKK